MGDPLVQVVVFVMRRADSLEEVLLARIALLPSGELKVVPLTKNAMFVMEEFVLRFPAMNEQGEPVWRETSPAEWLAALPATHRSLFFEALPIAEMPLSVALAGEVAQADL